MYSITGNGIYSVSYTHLDVYKRQGWRRAALAHRAACALLGAVYAVCLAVSLLELARYEKTPLPETGAGLPLLTLAEVEGTGYRRAAEAAPNVRDDRCV